MNTKKRLAKVLAAAGVASRRKCESLIFEGRVLVNGKKCQEPQTLVSLETDTLKVDGTLISQTEKKVAFVLNKPLHYLCTQKRPNNKAKIVTDLFASLPHRLFTVGRLDKETTGLLIVTNDGHLANAIIHPSKNIKKEYIAKVDKEISDTHLKAIQQGAVVEGTFVRPKKVAKVRGNTLKIVVGEGKKREVRRLLKKAGLEVQSLKRVAIGNLRLGNLEEGTFRPLTAKDINALFA